MIDKDALEEAVQGAINIMESNGISMIAASVPLAIIKGAPTIDAIPVGWIEDMLREWHKNKAPFEVIGAVSGMLVRWHKEQEAR